MEPSVTKWVWNELLLHLWSHFYLLRTHLLVYPINLIRFWNIWKLGWETVWSGIMPNLHKIGNQQRHMNNLGSLDSWIGVHHKFVFLQSPPGLVFSLMMRNGAGSHQCPFTFQSSVLERKIGWSTSLYPIQMVQLTDFLAGKWVHVWLVETGKRLRQWKGCWKTVGYVKNIEGHVCFEGK